MSASNTQNASTDINQTVVVVPTGIAGNPYYHQDSERFAQQVESELSYMGYATGDVEEVVVRGSHEIAKILSEHLSDSIDVESYSMDFRRMLDDEGVEEAEGDDDGTVQSVIEDGEPIVNIVADVHGLSEEEQANFNLDDRDDRSLVGSDVLDELEDRDGGKARIGRAKAKSKARATEMLVNDWYDYTPTADRALIIEDGTDAYQDAADDVRGHHDWSKFPSSCDGKINTLSLSGGQGGSLNWTHAMLVRGQMDESELTEGQIQRLRETLGEGAFSALDLDADYVESESKSVSKPSADERPSGEAAAVAGPADD